MSDTLLTILGYIITAIVSIYMSQMVFKSSLAGMAKTSFELGERATRRVKELEDKIDNMNAMLDGRMKLSVEFSMGDLLKDGQATLENGRIVIVKKPV